MWAAQVEVGARGEDGEKRGGGARDERKGKRVGQEERRGEGAREEGRGWWWKFQKVVGVLVD